VARRVHGSRPGSIDAREEDMWASFQTGPARRAALVLVVGLLGCFVPVSTAVPPAAEGAVPCVGPVQPDLRPVNLFCTRDDNTYSISFDIQNIGDCDVTADFQCQGEVFNSSTQTCEDNYWALIGVTETIPAGSSIHRTVTVSSVASSRTTCTCWVCPSARRSAPGRS
jgi:hypothetical protein